MKPKLIVPAILAAAAAAVPVASASSPEVLDSKNTTSAYAVASAIVDEGHSRYGISVATSPSKQKVALKWSVDCSKGGDKKKSSATANQKAPYTVWLDAPIKGGYCNVLGTATRNFTLKGRLIVKVLGTK